MTDWTAPELAAFQERDELEIASYRADGTLRSYTVIWMVRVGDELYVRTAYGPNAGWFRRAKAGGSGRVRVGEIERDVDIRASEESAREAVDAAYLAKYERYGRGIVGGIVGPKMHELTLLLDPR